MKKHRFKTINKLGKTRKQKQHKKVRVGSRRPGNTNSHGTIRRPY